MENAKGRKEGRKERTNEGAEFTGWLERMRAGTRSRWGLERQQREGKNSVVAGEVGRREAEEKAVKKRKTQAKRTLY